MTYIYTLKEADCENGPFKASLDKESLVQYVEERYMLDLTISGNEEMPMARPFNELTAQLWKKRDERYYKVIRWLELEADHREGHLVAFTERHYEKLKLEEELFGGIK